jgi:membrane protein implicated in regulation of membrane protease activity
VKNRTALKQSVASVKFLALAIVVMLILTVKYPSGYTIVPLGFFAVFFFIDAMIVRRIRRRALQDPTYLDQKLTDKHGRSV